MYKPRRVIPVLWATMVLGGCSASLENNIEGTWGGTDSAGHNIMIQFSGDDLALTQDDRTLTGKWVLDTDKQPAQMTLKMHTPAGSIQQVPMIAEMVSRNKLKLRVGTDLKSRPTGFTAISSNQMVLKRLN